MKTEKRMMKQVRDEGTHLRSLLPADPLDMTDGAIAAVARDRKLSRGANLPEVMADMRQRIAAASDSPSGPCGPTGGGDNQWYYTMYLSTPQKRRDHIVLRLTSIAVG